MTAFWLLHPLSGRGYQFFSGIGSSVLEALTILVALGAWYMHHNCIQKGCWRKGHPDPDHGHPVCKKHSSKID